MANSYTARWLLALLLVSPTFAHAASPVDREDKQQKKQDAINQAHAAQVDAAKKAANDWLPLLDADKYGEAWKAAAPFLQKNVIQSDWEKHLDQTRKPLDPFIERTLTTTQYRDQFPGLPPGQYVALVWESYFGAHHQMLESVIMTVDHDQWKPVGYAVQ